MMKSGDYVQVRSREEILATLDENGCLDGMPFMPEMLRFCGKRIRIWKVAHKTCDTVTKSGGRAIPEAVHLEYSRCDGSAHDGCQARCNLFWKTTWYDNRVTDPVSNVTISTVGTAVTQQRQNLGRTHIRGIQTDVDYQFADHWQVGGGYLFNQATVEEFQNAGKALARAASPARPKS